MRNVHAEKRVEVAVAQQEVRNDERPIQRTRKELHVHCESVANQVNERNILARIKNTVTSMLVSRPTFTTNIVNFETTLPSLLRTNNKINTTIYM